MEEDTEKTEEEEFSTGPLSVLTMTVKPGAHQLSEQQEVARPCEGF
jgi:hypothetical protein